MAGVTQKQAEIFIEIAGGRKSLIILERKQEYSKSKKKKRKEKKKTAVVLTIIKIMIVITIMIIAILTIIQNLMQIFLKNLTSVVFLNVMLECI